MGEIVGNDLPGFWCEYHGFRHENDLHSRMKAEIKESQVLAKAAKIEYDRMTPEQQAEVDRRWAATPEWKKQDLRDEIEMDLL